MTSQELYERTRAFLLRGPLKHCPPDSLTLSTRLVSSGLLDSIGQTELAMFLEDECNVRLDELASDPERFDTLEHILAVVEAKRSLG